MAFLDLTRVPTSLRVRARLEVQPPGAVSPVSRLATAFVVSLLGSMLAALVLAQLGRAVFSVPASFDKFNAGGYEVLTAVGVCAAAVGWPLTQRLTAHPRWLYFRAAVVVTVVLLVPDVWLFTQAGNPTGPVVVLMLMHLAIAVVTYLGMTRLAPPRDPGTRGL